MSERSPYYISQEDLDALLADTWCDEAVFDRFSFRRTRKVRKSPIVLDAPRSEKDALKMVKRIRYGMIDRCHNPSSKGYKYYGARGIFVCDAWCDSFDAFLDDVGLPPSLMGSPSIDRIDNDLGYQPNNVRWLDRGENCGRAMRGRRHWRYRRAMGEI